MEINTQSLRKAAAKTARAYLAGTCSWDEFMKQFGPIDWSKDRLIADVVDMIEHQPKRGGLMGANEKDWAGLQAQLETAIRALEE